MLLSEDLVVSTLLVSEGMMLLQMWSMSHSSFWGDFVAVKFHFLSSSCPSGFPFEILYAVKNCSQEFRGTGLPFTPLFLLWFLCMVVAKEAKP